MNGTPDFSAKAAPGDIVGILGRVNQSQCFFAVNQSCTCPASVTELELAMLNHSEMKLLLELAGLSTREVMLTSKAHKTVSHAVREKRNTSSRTLAYWEHYFNGLQSVSGSQEQTSEVPEAGLVGSYGAPLNLGKWRALHCLSQLDQGLRREGDSFPGLRHRSTKLDGSGWGA